jgi:hypothetical protein
MPQGLLLVLRYILQVAKVGLRATTPSTAAAVTFDNKRAPVSSALEV